MEPAGKARERGEWAGKIGARKEPDGCPEICITNPHDRDKGGQSRPFLGVDRDGRRWYVKPLNNGQAPRVTITEYIVSSAGRLIGAPVCDTAIVRIPGDVAGQPYFDNRVIEAGYAHGSREVPDTHLGYHLDHRVQDLNRVRHCGVIALFDWCWGDDAQWLFETVADMRLHSHDHGRYFPGGFNWSVERLTARVNEPHPWDGPTYGLDHAELVRLAEALDALSADALSAVLTAVPSSWPIMEQELETVGFFLFRRAPAVAARLRALGGAA